MNVDLEIAQAATLKPIAAVAETAGIPADALDLFRTALSEPDDPNRDPRTAIEAVSS